MATQAPLTGQVLAFDEASGLGTVGTTDGASWEFHCTRLVDGSRSVEPGTPVAFLVAPGRPGAWEATAIVKLVLPEGG